MVAHTVHTPAPEATLHRTRHPNDLGRKLPTPYVAGAEVTPDDFVTDACLNL